MDFNCLSPYDKMMLIFQLICAVDAAFGIYEKLHRRASKHDN